MKKTNIKEMVRKVIKPAHYELVDGVKVFRDAVFEMQEQSVQVWIVQDGDEEHIFKDESKAISFKGGR